MLLWLEAPLLGRASSALLHTDFCFDYSKLVIIKVEKMFLPKILTALLPGSNSSNIASSRWLKQLEDSFYLRWEGFYLGQNFFKNLQNFQQAFRSFE